MALGRFVNAVCLVALALGLVGCDHATKIAAKASLEGATAVPIAPAVLHGAVELRYVQNDDIAFSALRQLGVPRSPALLSVVALAAIGTIAVLALAARRRRPQREGAGADGRFARVGLAAGVDGRFACVGLALVLGGAIGNVIDRIARGYVVDF